MPIRRRPDDHLTHETLEAFVRGTLSKSDRRLLGARFVADRDLREWFDDMAVVRGMLHGFLSDVAPGGRESCAAIRPQLAALKAGEAEPLDALRVVRHLNACKDCGRSPRENRRSRGAAK